MTTERSGLSHISFWKMTFTESYFFLEKGAHLRISITNLLVFIRFRFPNLVVGVITRDSVREALIMGITAEQVLAFTI